MAEEDAKERGFAVEEVLACMEKALIGAFKKSTAIRLAKWNSNRKKTKYCFIRFIRL